MFTRLRVERNLHPIQALTAGNCDWVRQESGHLGEHGNFQFA